MVHDPCPCAGSLFHTRLTPLYLEASQVPHFLLPSLGSERSVMFRKRGGLSPAVTAMARAGAGGLDLRQPGPTDLFFSHSLWFLLLAWFNIFIDGSFST